MENLEERQRQELIQLALKDLEKLQTDFEERGRNELNIEGIRKFRAKIAEAKRLWDY